MAFLANRSAPSSRLIRISVLFLLVVALGYAGLRNGLSGFGRPDFIQYWAAARLFVGSGNPYSVAEMATVQAPYGIADIAILQWNPPIIFPVTLAFSLLPFEAAAWVWLLLMSAAILVIIVLSFAEFQRQAHTSYSVGAILFCLTFYPFAAALYWGQLSPLLGLGWAGALFLGRSERFRGRFLAGVCLVLTALKPHLLFLVYAWLLWCGRKRQWRPVLSGLLAAVAGLSLISLIIRPDIYSLYRHAFDSPPIYWKTPTLGSWLQQLMDIHTLAVRMLPTALILGVFLVCLSIRLLPSARGAFDFALVLMPLSLLAAPYGWQYDHILLFPSALWCFGRVRQAPISGLLRNVIETILVMLNVVVLLSPPNTEMHYFVWYPALLFAICLFLWRTGDQGLRYADAA